MSGIMMSTIASYPSIQSGSMFLTTSSANVSTTVLTAPGTTACTYECYFRTLAGLRPGDNVLLNTSLNGNSGSGGGLILTWINGVYMVVSVSGLRLNTGVSVALGVWNHVAVTIAAGAGTNSGKLWVNGTSLGSFTPGTSLTSTNLYIGGKTYAGIVGYYSNFRYVLGTEVYTDTFIPPTRPLTVTQSAGANISAITAGQTQLLLNTATSETYLTDSSTYAHGITASVNVSYSSLNPFV